MAETTNLRSNGSHSLDHLDNIECRLELLDLCFFVGFSFRFDLNELLHVLINDFLKLVWVLQLNMSMFVHRDDILEGGHGGRYLVNHSKLIIPQSPGCL